MGTLYDEEKRGKEIISGLSGVILKQTKKGKLKEIIKEIL